MARRLLLVGASGAIGGAIAKEASARGWQVSPAGRGSGAAIRYDIRSGGFGDLGAAAPFDAVCWAQGANLSDSVFAFDVKQHLELYEANVLTIAHGLAQLIERGALSDRGARLCVISSIWQESARPDRLSYAVTKAALGGLVRATSADLAPHGHLINAVLPGVIDTPMTLRALSTEQIAGVEELTGAGRLPDLGSVVASALFLLSEENRSITGQSLAVDLGFSVIRRL
jgi:3-oxoacyl-[acyl-carrier protein] reductase